MSDFAFDCLIVLTVGFVLSPVIGLLIGHLFLWLSSRSE